MLVMLGFCLEFPCWSHYGSSQACCTGYVKDIPSVCVLRNNKSLPRASGLLRLEVWFDLSSA